MISCIFYFLNIRVVVNVNYSGLSRPFDEFLFPGQKRNQTARLYNIAKPKAKLLTVKEWQ